MKHDSSTIGWNQAGKDWCDAIAKGHPMDPGFLFMDRLFGWIGDIAGKRVLDLGCGEGRHARAAVRRGNGRKRLLAQPRSFFIIEPCRTT